MATLKVRNPIALSVETQVNPAPRLRDLRGKRVGLYWNFKSGGDWALQRVEERLKERFPDTHFASFVGDVGFTMRHCTPKLADRIAKECDIIVGTTSD